MREHVPGRLIVPRSLRSRTYARSRPSFDKLTLEQGFDGRDCQLCLSANTTSTKLALRMPWTPKEVDLYD